MLANRFRHDVLMRHLASSFLACQLLLQTAAGARAGDDPRGNAFQPGPPPETRDMRPAVIEFAEDTLELETGKPDIKLHYRVHSPSGREITRVRVLIDGHAVNPRSAVGIDESAGSQVLTLNVPPRDSKVTLVAYIGDQPSDPVSMPVKWKGILKKPRLFALLVGISDYDSGDLKLNYADKDASALAISLESQEGMFYDNVEVKTLLNDEATEIAIRRELARLRNQSTPEDYVVIFMAGHGVTDQSRDFYFLPTSVDLSPNMLSATALDGDLIQKALAKIPGKVILFMDACYAGAGIEADMAALSNGLRSGASLVMFASSEGSGVAFESPEWGHGAFTAALLAILSDPNAYGTDRKLSIFELGEELTFRVKALTDDRQTPVMTMPGAVELFFLAAL